MNTKWVSTIIALLMSLVIVGCQPGLTASVPPSIDWSRVNIPSVGEEGNWALAPGMICWLKYDFSADGKTIFAFGDTTVRGLIGPEMSFLIKSDDYGDTWSLLPGLEELDLWESIGIEVVDNTLFISTTDKGIYRSTDGGQTFDRLASVPGLEEGRAWIWSTDVTVDASGNPIVLAATNYGQRLGGAWMLSYPYDTWVDLRVGNIASGTGYQVLSIVFAPDYAENKQIIAAISDLEHLRVTMKFGDEDWGERIADAYVPDSATDCDLEWVSLAFPDDYDSQNPVVFLGIGLFSEHLYQTPQYTDLYRIDGRPASSGLSIATDLDVGGKGTSTAIYSVLVKGAADSATILAGSVGQVYRSTDGGKTWGVARKPPTGGAIASLSYGPANVEGSLVYCVSTDSWNVLVPRNASVPVGEVAFCRSIDGGITWDELSMIGTTIDEIISRAVSPNYARDNTLFMLTRSSSTLTVSLDEDEVVSITREPDNPGATAKVIVVVHGDNPPSERMEIGDQAYVVATGANLLLDDGCPVVSLRVLPILEQPGVEDLLQQCVERYGEWWAEQYLAIYHQPRKAVIYVLDGWVTVTKREQVEEEEEGSMISVDGDGSDWQGIEPLATDPEGDAPSKDEDMKAFYTTNDSEYLYVMVELYGENPRTKCDIEIDADLDGDADYIILIKSPDEPYGPAMHLFPVPRNEPTPIAADMAAFDRVIEARIPLAAIAIGNSDEFSINRVQLLSVVGEDWSFADEWEGPLNIEIEQFADPDLTPIPFPTTQSLWKTTDGGETWERILTSGLKLLVDGEEVPVGPLESVVLSHNFAQDNTLFVFEGCDEPKVWVSTDGGAIFTQSLPTITLVNPDQGNQRETLSVTIAGTYFTGATGVSFGDGVTVNSFTVDSPTQITADITIDATATTGARDVSVTTPGGTDALAGGFNVHQQAPVLPEEAAEGGLSIYVIVGIAVGGAAAAAGIYFFAIRRWLKPGRVE